jgi:23S rRNA pseudouridine2605 synthase
MKLQKALQIISLSRRHSSEYILTKGVKVNGKLVKEPWYELQENDLIEFDNKKYYLSDLQKKAESKVYYLLNKPKGVLCTFKDQYGRKTINDLLKGKIEERVFYVGRLDYDSSGILLLTNDGELANYLLRPENKVTKVYEVLVKGTPSKKELQTLEQGITLETGYKTMKSKVKILKKEKDQALLQISLNEGKKRQIKLMIKALGYKVIELKRIKFGPWSIEEVPKPGDIKSLGDVEEVKNSLLSNFS